jgi:predicted nicotinamide N-methyase
VLSEALDLVDEPVTLGGHELAVLRPRDSEALLDDEAFEREEFLPYWAELWPSGLALARHVATQPLRGRTVLELGCGLALPSLAAALGGARVLATDWSPDAVELAAVNARRNGIALETAVVSWARPDVLVSRAPWHLVLAADVLYERRNVSLLFDLLPRLVGDTGEVLIADPGRPPAPEFVRRAGEAGWRLDDVASEQPRLTVRSLRPRLSRVTAAP